MSAQPSVLQVVILRDGLLIGTEVFIPGVYTLGSGSSCDLQLDDPAVAERHAVLYFKNGKAAIQDVGGSTRGIYVNGHRVNACEVRPVDEVACGPFVLKARVIQQRPAEEKPKPPPEVAALLGGTPALGTPAAGPQVWRPPAAPASAGPITSLSARKRAQAEAAARAPAHPDGDRPTIPTPLEARAAPQREVARPAPQPPPPAAPPRHEPMATVPGRLGAVQPRAPAAGPVDPDSVAWPELWPTPAPHGSSSAFDLAPDVALDPPTVGIELPDDQGPTAVGAPEIPPPSPKLVPNLSRSGPPPSAVPTRSSQDAVRGSLARAARPAREPEPARQLVAVPSAQHRVQREAAGAPVVKLGKGGRGRARLYFDLYWGGERHEARSFRPKNKKPVIGGARDSADVPLYGFGLSGDFVLGARAAGGFRVFVPPGARVERARIGEPFAPAPPESVSGSGSSRSVVLKSGAAVRFTTDGPMSLVAYAAPPPEKTWVNPLRGKPYLLLTLFALSFYGLGTFIYYVPSEEKRADFDSKNLPALAVKLITPEPKRQERVKKELQKLKEHIEERKKAREREEAAVTHESKQPPKLTGTLAENKALKAIAKLHAAGPAMGDILAAMDKVGGGGPGSKNAKKGAYGLTGLIGKGLAAPGNGTWGLGTGAGTGIGTKGAEILRGKGGGGVGLMGARGIGKGSVGGTVGRAVTRDVGTGGSSGTIDRDAVARVINDHMHEVQSCYERALLKEPGLSGKASLEWTIGMNGHVTAVRTKMSTLRNPSVESCIIGAIKGWLFPQPRGGSVIISYPFIFNAVGF